MAAAVVMIICLPMVLDYITLPISISVGGIILLGVLAGLTNPQQVWIMILDTLAALIGSIVFETAAIGAFVRRLDYFFVINQILALLFLFALYYATKTWRGKMIK